MENDLLMIWFDQMPKNMTSIKITLMALAIAEPFVTVFSFALDYSSRIMNTTINAMMRWQLVKVIGWFLSDWFLIWSLRFDVQRRILFIRGLDNLTLILASVFAFIWIDLVPDFSIVFSAAPIHAHHHPVSFLIKVFITKFCIGLIKNTRK